MDDLISRQAAIDATDAVWSVTGDKNVAKVWDQIKDLPSAQFCSDDKRCKNCIYQLSFPGGKCCGIEMEMCDPYELSRRAWDDNWFCADWEGKKG